MEPVSPAGNQPKARSSAASASRGGMGTVGALSCPVGQGRWAAREKARGVETRLRLSGRRACYRAADRGYNARH